AERKEILTWPRVVAVDCPSGLNCDTGALDAVALAADLTVTFAHAKWGHFLFPGAGACGRLLVAEIGIPASLAEDVQVEVATPEMVRAWLPRRPADAHKGTFGRALIVAGSANYTGAAYLAGAAAYRAGAGLVTLGVARPLHPTLAAALHETTWLLLPHDMGVLAPDAAKMVREKAGDYRALLLGPGLGQETPTVEFVRQLLEPKTSTPTRAPRIGFQALRAAEPQPAEAKEPPHLPPLVLDADALNILAATEEWPRRVPAHSILTPHPGEMARLCNLKTEEIAADRLGLARAKAAEWNQVIVLKGAHTVCAAPDGRAVVQPFANPALATAGSGDVLAGAIVGLLAQGLEPFAAAVAGTYLHGLAGEWVRRALGDAGAVAGDLLPRLPEVLRALRGG
ncbi:MAG: bifunctional ADP-dependent NAD(P)H-hydrate dehydratase/NAD(P)H-hydrate epimerase, partial [Anaerolineae bacterium]|nr:bifunctional ADP-dependent NAD(P)H-hydrate dehydratase/NAD(P)H-hydrate epimerase [Anaerolineae bacterium]